MSESFNEMIDAEGGVRPAYRQLQEWLESTPREVFDHRRSEVDALFRRLGITFAVYGEGGDTERLIPFDIVPRILTRTEWDRLSAGLVQRVAALNAFLHDIYHDQEILRAGRIPADLVLLNEQYRPEMQGFDPVGGVYNHISGIDVVRVAEDDFYVLEDNMRVPSGVSYMLEGREIMMRMFPDLFSVYRVAPVDHYPDMLLATLRSVAPAGDNPTVAVVTPGVYNSAYFEHSFLAEQMGIDLVEGQDLFVSDGYVFMRTPQGPRRVDVIYRRIDDDFVDPLTFNPDSVLGVAGLFAAYRMGNVTLANAIGTGVADDKSIYPYVPEMIRFYRGEEPLLKNVPTHVCRDPETLAYVVDHLPQLVVKEVHGSGGYGMLVGPASTREQIESFRQKLLSTPDKYIAQPTLALSTCPTFVEEGIAPRHVDLRPFVLSGSDGVQIVSGAFTRVALRKGSLVVNSSQGGGTKDTWVVEDI
jgi:uncharacterized circularly permuted ATP-grasp superfamily protein